MNGFRACYQGPSRSAAASEALVRRGALVLIVVSVCLSLGACEGDRSADNDYLTRIKPINQDLAAQTKVLASEYASRLDYEIFQREYFGKFISAFSEYIEQMSSLKPPPILTQPHEKVISAAKAIRDQARKVETAIGTPGTEDDAVVSLTRLKAASDALEASCNDLEQTGRSIDGTLSLPCDALLAQSE